MTNFSKKNSSSGFTLIELLVVITIFVVLTTVVIFNQNSFDNSILLNNLAYDVALTIRQAQVYGVSTREAASSSASFPAYGVYFDKGSDNKIFVLFADTNGNHMYDGTLLCSSSDIECVQRFTINRGDYISLICVGANKDTCDSGVSKAQIYFQRPNPNANIFNLDGSSPVQANSITIGVSSKDGTTRNVIVSGIGQIYVQQ